jgi:hypothetical protein
MIPDINNNITAFSLKKGRCSTQESQRAAWVLFRDELIDCKLRYAILTEVLGATFDTMTLEHQFRPFQIELGLKHLLCGVEAFYKLQER